MTGRGYLPKIVFCIPGGDDLEERCDPILTAEGVEQEWQRELLRELGCTEMQGYLFSPAVSAAELTRLMAGARDKAASAA